MQLAEEQVQHGNDFDTKIGDDGPELWLRLGPLEHQSMLRFPNIEMASGLHATGRSFMCFVQAGGFGQLTGGHIVDCDCSLSRKLLASPPCAMLAALGAAIPFELAIGQNGRVWVSAASASLTVLVANALQQAHLSSTQADVFVKRLLQSVR